ncbi:MAG: hypothetical protein EPN74_00675 [Rhodanobacter sp.]|nr:MAG: hypothetical protein EPN74_00675 [Rhodanobacter sp.]
MTVREALSDIREGFREDIAKDIKEAPRKFFAPLITLTRWMCRVSDEGMAPPMSTFTLSPMAKESLQAVAARLGISSKVALELAIQQLDIHTSSSLKHRYRPLDCARAPRPKSGIHF